MDTNQIKILISSGKEELFYWSPDWRKLKEDIKHRDNHECQMCAKQGRYGPPEAVHHIKHLKKHPELAMDPDNLITLCKTCHNLVHPEKRQGFKVSEHQARWE